MPSHVDLIFLIDFCSQLGPPNPENSSPHCSESTIFLKSHFDVHMDFWFDFGANLAPFWLPKSSKILPKIDPKRHQFFDRFLHRFFIDFCSFWDPNLGPCWPHFRSKWGGRVACSRVFCWVYVIFRFLCPPGPLLAPFWGGWGSIFRFFDRFWGRFWKVLGSSLEVSGDHVGPMCSAFLAKHFVY